MKRHLLFILSIFFLVLLAGCADTTPPVLDGITNEIINVGDSFDLLEGVTASDNKDGDITTDIEYVVKNETEESVTFNTNVVFVYYIIYSVSDSRGNIIEKTRTITVINDSDILAPIISGVVDITVDTEDSYDPLTNLSVIDDVDGDLLSDVVVTITDSDLVSLTSVNLDVIGDYYVTYFVSDSASNTTTVVITVTVEDTTPPVIDAVDIALNNDTYIDMLDWSYALDNIDGDITDDITYTILDTDNNTVEDIGFVAGVYTVTYAVSDSSGNEASTTIEVTVTDIMYPVITITQSVVYIPYNGLFDFYDYVSALDETAGDLTSSITDVYFDSDLTIVEFDTVTPGSYILELTVSDYYENETVTSMIVIVGSSEPVNFNLDVTLVEQLISELYYDAFDSTLTIAEICAKYLDDIPFEVDHYCMPDCEVGFEKVRTMYAGYTVDEVIKEVIDGKAYYTVTVTLLYHNATTITFDFVIEIIGYEYSEDYYINYISSPFGFGPVSTVLSLLDAEAELEEYYDNLIDGTYPVEDFCNNYVLNAITNDATLQECIDGVTNIRSIATAYQINTVVESLIQPPEGDPFVGYRANITVTTIDGEMTFDVYFAFFEVEGEPVLSLFGSPLGND